MIDATGAAVKPPSNGKLASNRRVMNLGLTDEETAALLRELDRIIAEDRYPLSARIRTLKAIRAKIRPERERGPLPPPKQYAPPRAAASRRRRYGRRAGEISPAHLGRAVARRIAPELCSKHTGQAGEEFEPLVVLAKCLIVGR
jgi:hypothetical protein